MKRIISILLISVLLLTSFSGCAGQPADSAPDPQMLLGEGTVLSQQERPEFSQGSGETPFSSDPVVLSSQAESSSGTDMSSRTSEGSKISSQAAGSSSQSQTMGQSGASKQDPAARRVPARKAVLLRPVKVPVPAATPAMNIGRCGFPIWIFPECSKGRDSRLFEKISERPFKMCRIWDAMW